MCILNNCKSKGKYGEYCYKHRRYYLVDHETNQIIRERWTNKCSDYLKEDILNTLFFFGNKSEGKENKKQLFLNLSEIINNLQKYDEKDIQRIIYLQNKIKRKREKKLSILRGEGYFNKKLCNNDTDFFSFESVNEINDKYFFSYKDENGFIWFFDIRSFNKLIEMKQPNPYTLGIIPNTIIETSKKLTELLFLKEEDELINKNEIKKTKKQIIKQKTIDLFGDIDQSGYYCQPEWFLSLNLIKLKKLYSNLEDIWNYRLQLSNQEKSRICPPNGLVFTTRVSDVQRYTHREDVQDLILNEVIKFQNAINPEDRKLGYMYFIIGLGGHGISQECLNCHNWLMYV